MRATRHTPLPLVHLALAAVPLLWGLNFICTKIVLARWDPLAFLALRFLAMTPLALVWARSGGPIAPISRRDWPAFLAAGLLGIAVYQLCIVLSIQRTSIFASALFAGSFPLFTMMAAAALGDEHPRPLRWAGALVAFFGLAVFEGLFAGRASFRPGDLLALAAALAFTPYTLIVRRVAARYSSVTLVAQTLVIGTVALLAFGWPALVHQDYGRLLPLDWALFVYVVIFPVVIGYAILNWAVVRIGAGPASMYALAVPVIGGVASALLFHTPFGPGELLGGAVCLLGLGLVQVAGERRA